MSDTNTAVFPYARPYDVVARILHWLVLGLLIVQFALAWTMPDVRRGTTPETLINLHLSFGFLILAVILVRLAWRLTHPAPPPPLSLPEWQHVLSQIVHGALYLVLIVIPVFGWINASWRGWHLTFFGLFDMPPLIAARGAAGQGPLAGGWTGDIHGLIATYLLLGLVALHVLAALYHASRRDGVFTRMWTAR